MTAWETIKAKMTNGTLVGTLGYHGAMNRAAELFIDVLPYLKNEEKEKEIFNQDPDILPAITLKKELKEVGIL